MSFAEHTLWQYLFPPARDSYRLPESDLPADRYLERPMPRELRDGQWVDHPIAEDVIALPRMMNRRASEAAGRPAQIGHPTRRITWTITPSYGPSYTVSAPAPAQGTYWVERAPRPLFAKVRYDNHVIVTDPNGGWWELIGVSNWGAWRASGLAQYDRHGELVRGRPVIAAKRSLLPMLWNRHDLPHLCTVSVRGTDHDANFRQYLGKWLVLDAGRVPRPDTDDGGRLWDALTTFGAIYGDHGGRTNLSSVSGSQWGGVDWGGLEFRLSDFLEAS